MMCSSFCVADHQRIAAGEQDIADLGVAADVLDARGDRFLGDVAGAPHHAFARAEAAVHRAAVRDQEEHAIRVAVRQARHGAVLVLVERILRRVLVLQLLDRRDGLHPDRIALLPDQVVVVARDPHRVDLAAPRRFPPRRRRNPPRAVSPLVTLLRRSNIHCSMAEPCSLPGKSLHKRRSCRRPRRRNPGSGTLPRSPCDDRIRTVLAV